MKKNLLLLGICIAFMCSLIYLQVFKMQAMGKGWPALTSYFFSVGQGDASLIRTPGNKWILIDGGPEYESAVQAVEPIVSSFTGKIDMVILSHPHKDHIAGLMKVLDTYAVGSILMFSVDSNELQEQLKVKSKEKGVPIIEADPLRDIQLDEATFIDIIAPLTTADREEKNINNLSLVFMIKSGMHTILYTGDAEIEEEKEILLSQSFIDADILKGGHHGSKTSTSIPFLNAVSPELVVFMNGKGNTFRHPDPETLEVLEERRIPYFNTSLDGTVSVRCVLTEEKCETEVSRK